MTAASASESATLARAQRGLAAARRPFAPGPGAEAERLREAYLGLLKLCLCDLAATTTTSVGRTERGVVASRELAGEQLRLRAAGMDWPLHGMTMVGLRRLDDLQACVEAVVRDGVEGELIEAGSWRGGASILIRATLDSLGAQERTVWVADSFQGFPLGETARRSDEQWSEIDYLSVPLDEVRANFARLGVAAGVEFLPGFFSQTLPGLAGRRWSLVRLDGDTYDATVTALRCLYPGLSAGGFLIVDDYGALADCRRAVDEFRTAAMIHEPLEEVDWTSVRWRKAVESPIPTDGGAAGRAALDGGSATPVARSSRRIPSLHELELARELEQLRSRLAAAEHEVARRRAAPLRARLRRKLARRESS
ncbi:MAG: class I SAM-dependent methyltransferase [Solirubrobacterales bacterium]|nr:class I SAM-dependent methyltransferase [Solirubrobacterales bacterium]MBV9714928.1 class I SAM-dependent methyltransferase [Solirubrobacterales bacterium]